MSKDLEAMAVAKKRLFGKNGIKAQDVKMFRGSSADITPEDYAKEINKAISKIENGDFEEVNY